MYQSSSELGPGDVSRTVSRSPSDASMNSGKAAEAAATAEKINRMINNKSCMLNTATGNVSADEIVEKVSYTNKKPKIMHKARNNEKALMSTEKAAVAAMLAMKTSSDESDGESIAAVTQKSVIHTQHKHQQPESTQQQQQHALSSLSLVESI